MALRTAVLAEPAPSVPMSRSAVKPAIRSAFAARGRQDRPLRFGFLDRLQVFRAGMQKKMHMRVDQAGKQCGVAKIDHFGIRRMFHGCAGSHDALAFDQNFAGADDVAGLHVEQARGVQDDRMRGTRRGRNILRIRQGGKNRNNQREQSEMADFHALDVPSPIPTRE